MAQMLDLIDGGHSRAMERSVLGLVYTYNALPQRVVDLTSVKMFQRKLQLGLQQLAHKGDPSWNDLWRTGVKSMQKTLFQDIF